MDTLTPLLILLAGFLLRLAIPILMTALLVYILRKLDARWQVEAQQPLPVQKPECWKVKECPPQQRAECIAFKSSLPCWQAFRYPNGYLREDCLSCKVFRDAPVPTYKVDPRSM
jgi:hypothetical protein